MPPRPRFDRRAPVRELPNINDRINYPQLRVVDADGTQLGVIDREEALSVAKERELDLVLVSEKADPPVCRIMDYGKYKFERGRYMVIPGCEIFYGVCFQTMIPCCASGRVNCRSALRILLI